MPTNTPRVLGGYLHSTHILGETISLTAESIFGVAIPAPAHWALNAILIILAIFILVRVTRCVDRCVNRARRWAGRCIKYVAGWCLARISDWLTSWKARIRNCGLYKSYRRISRRRTGGTD